MKGGIKRYEMSEESKAIQRLPAGKWQHKEGFCYVLKEGRRAIEIDGKVQMEKENAFSFNIQGGTKAGAEEIAEKICMFLNAEKDPVLAMSLWSGLVASSSNRCANTLTDEQARREELQMHAHRDPVDEMDLQMQQQSKSSPDIGDTDDESHW